MKKYCKKCGKELDAFTNKCPNCDSANHKTSNLKKRAIVLTIIALVLVIVTASTLVYFDFFDLPFTNSSNNKSKNNETIITKDDNYTNIDGTFTDQTITDEDSALKAIEDASDLIGIDDVDESLDDCQNEVILDNQYYRFSQEYKDIPVYGRSVTVSSDDQGNCLKLSGNYLDLDDIDVDVEYSEDKAIKKMKKEHGDDAAIESKGLTIYTLNNHEPEIAWQLNIYSDKVHQDCFISAKSGDILASIDSVYYDNVTGVGKDIDGVDQSFLTENDNGTYKMIDQDKKIIIYDSQDNTLIRNIAICDNNNNYYYLNNGQFYDNNNNVVTVQGTNYNFTISDSSGNTLGTNGRYVVNLSTDGAALINPTSTTTNWNNPKAVTLMSRISRTYDFWLTNYNRKGYDNKEGTIVGVYNDHNSGDTTNAYSWQITEIPVTILSFATDNSLAVDTVGHEYMHSVERSISNMVYLGESGALMEAYSDIFGEIIEDWYDNGTLDNSCNWVHGSIRNMIDPTQNNNPATYQGTHWQDTNNTSRDNGGVHTNNTVISHAAYLMWAGIDGSSNYEGLGTLQLSNLFYSTLPYVPSDCNFYQFKMLLLDTAMTLYNQGHLTNKQCLTVEEAFNQVNLNGQEPLYSMAATFDLNVYDINNELYDNYSLLIEQFDDPSQGLNSSMTKIDEIKVKDNKPYSVSLNDGTYRLIITDLSNNNTTKTRYINVNQSGETNLTVFTNFEKSNQSSAPVSSSTIPDDAVEFNGHHYYIYQDNSVDSGQAAIEFCQDHGDGYLATITSKEENDFLYDYVTNSGYQEVYFGLSDSEKEGSWKWLNEEKVDYTNWDRNQPGKNSNANYAMFNGSDSWEDGNFSKNDYFICEWGDFTPASIPNLSSEREIVLVLDTSNSMTGTPIRETKKAAKKFVDTILDEDACIGILTYNDTASKASEFSIDQDDLDQNISNLKSSGNTNIEDGLSEAAEMLESGNAKKKIIVLMSDGLPNRGKESDELIDYADDIKESGVLIYTLGFFEKLKNKSSPQQLMEEIASEGCHFEVSNSDDLVFFFNDVADQINGQRYIYIKIACPVDVSVSYDGDTLNSSNDDLNTRTDFGVLSFEDNPSGDQTKILRLKEEHSYDIEINGTGQGYMNYTIAFMDDDGNYDDFREFKDIEITSQTIIDTKAEVSDNTIVNVDKDGDGKYDLSYEAGQNQEATLVKTNNWINIAATVLIVAVGGLAGFTIIRKKSWK